jgi:hypothetical protein
MEMADQPDDGDTERNHQDEKNDPAFAPFLAHRNTAAAGAAIIAPAFVLQRDRNIQPAASFAGSGQQLVLLPACRFFGHAGSVRDHAFQFFHLAPQLRLTLGEFVLLLVEWCSGFTVAHAESLTLRGHPEEDQERGQPENNQRQRQSEPDLHPLREGFSTAQSRQTGGGLGQIQIG